MDPGKAASDLLDLVGLVVRGASDNRDLSFTAAAALRSLERHGSQRITAMAASEGVSQPSMTQLVQRLEQRGLVTRGSDPTDGRVALVSITDQGRAVLSARRARVAEWLEAMLADLPPGDARALADAVAAVLPAIRAHVSGAGGGWSRSSD